MQKISIIKLFFIYLKIGAILLGGGYVILPIIINEFCEKRDLVSKEEVTDYFALSQSLPGIIAANMSMFIGYKLCGKRGAIVAVIGIIFVPFWSIVILASVLAMIAEKSIVQAAFEGIGIAVIALITLTVREIWQKGSKDLFFYLILFVSLVLLLFFKLSPIQVILIGSLIGIWLKKNWRFEK